MTNNPLIPQSKLPQLGTTIFTRMSALAQQHQAINLSQGFPDFDGPRYLQERLAYHVAQGANQYAPMTGVQALREAIAQKTERLYGYQPDADSDITVTAGATEALYAAITALVRNGDEVICFDPSYDSYSPAIALSGGIVKRMALQPPHFRVDWQEFAALLSERTRLVILNTPHNPSATVWSDAQMRQLEDLLAPTNVLLLSDEVYEHMVFDGQPHQSAARFPGLAARAFIVSSFGKTYHVTGWKVGTIAAPAALMAEFRKVHQFNVFSVNTPMQAALASYMADPAPYLELPAFYQRKRDLFLHGLQATRLQPLPTRGTYFQCVDISAVTDLPEADFCRWLVQEIGVAAIPLSAFYGDGFDQQVVRFCFAKEDATLLAALERLKKL